MREAGFDIKEKPNYKDKAYLLSEIKRYIDIYGKQPTSKEIDSAKGFPSKSYYQIEFGSWNNALKKLNLKILSDRYTDDDLKNKFFEFVEVNGRPPKLHEFNSNDNYPSFWCYQNRFGSWNKALMQYGFEPYEGTAGKMYWFENGELCRSTYEYDLSCWLRNNNISYLRNVPFRDFIDDYEGRKDCDYVIIYNGEWIWLEIAGFYSGREKKSSLEKRYIERFEHKKDNLLNNFNFVVLEGHEFENASIDDLLDFIWDIPYDPYSANEPIYQGVDEDIQMEEFMEWLKS